MAIFVNSGGNPGGRIKVSKRAEEQANLFCVGCILRTCDEQSLHCRFRLLTKPNWQQKRKARHERRKAGKRAAETGRTSYWREYKQGKKAIAILGT